MSANSFASLVLGLALGFGGALLLPDGESEPIAVETPVVAGCEDEKKVIERLRQQVARLEGQVDGLESARLERALEPQAAPPPQIVYVQPAEAPPAAAEPAPRRTRRAAAPAAKASLRVQRGPRVIPQGDVAVVIGAVRNVGTAAGSGTLYIELLKNGSVVDEESVPLELAPGEEYKYNVTLRLYGEGEHSARAYVR